MTNNFRVQSFSSCHDAAPSCSTTCGKKIIWLTKSPCFLSCMTPISSEKHLVFLSYFPPIFYNFFWILQIQNKKYRKKPKFHFPATSGNEIFTEILAKFRRKSKPSSETRGHSPTPESGTSSIASASSKGGRLRYSYLKPCFFFPCWFLPFLTALFPPIVGTLLVVRFGVGVWIFLVGILGLGIPGVDARFLCYYRNCLGLRLPVGLFRCRFLVSWPEPR